ncbi:unnamed protein product [Haemonchus placei]|uniref:GAB1 n=1 Tax=Haemonchus placei TaxID=6290 RepID=A0A0N4WEJ6_HAEPC|nr:unnamed protein product [Haemonchus placei]
MNFKATHGFSVMSIAVVSGPTASPSLPQQRIVETLLRNATRLFGCPVVAVHGGSDGASNYQQNSSRSLSIDTNTPPKTVQMKERLELGSVLPLERSLSRRPKERAPCQPYLQPKTSLLVDLSDEDTNAELALTSTSAVNDSSYTQSHFLMSSQVSGSFRPSSTPSQDPDDSFDEHPYESLLSDIPRSPGEMITSSFNVPQRPPPPVFQSEADNSRSLSCKKAIEAEPIPIPRTRPSHSVMVKSSSSLNG